MYDKLKKYMEIADDNYFWRLSSGDHLNMLDSAIEEIERLQAENARLREDIEIIERKLGEGWIAELAISLAPQEDK